MLNVKEKHGGSAKYITSQWCWVYETWNGDWSRVYTQILACSEPQAWRWYGTFNLCVKNSRILSPYTLLVRALQI